MRGGNDIVFLNMQKARLGVLDMDQFKRQVRYATLPGGTVTDAVLQSGGRYNDLTDYMWMDEAGIWFENFALPAVINECLIQSYDGLIRLYPNWDTSSDAAFSTLRARGAFLVSASLQSGEVQPVEIYSERGGVCRVWNPWPGCSVKVSSAAGSKVYKGEEIDFKTEAGETYTLQPL